MAALPNVSSDVVWEIVRHQNSFLEKRKTNGGVQFSRDPLNLLNVHSRKYAGFVNDKAVGVAPNEKGGVKFVSKKKSGQTSETTFAGYKGSRRTFKAIAGATAKSGYRPDLRHAAVARASAIRQSQKPVKADPEAKLRGSKARKAAEADA